MKKIISSFLVVLLATTALFAFSQKEVIVDNEDITISYFDSEQDFYSNALAVLEDETNLDETTLRLLLIDLKYTSNWRVSDKKDFSIPNQMYSLACYSYENNYRALILKKSKNKIYEVLVAFN